MPWLGWPSWQVAPQRLTSWGSHVKHRCYLEQFLQSPPPPRRREIPLFLVVFSGRPCCPHSEGLADWGKPLTIQRGDWAACTPVMLLGSAVLRPGQPGPPTVFRAAEQNFSSYLC